MPHSGTPLGAFDPWTGLGVRLELDPAPLEAGGRVRWTFTITNHGPEQRLLTFASARRGEVVLEAGRGERYRWSRGRLFAATIEEKELDPGEEWGFSLEDVLSLPPGTYSLCASVTARQAPPTVRGEVSVCALP